MNDMNAPQAPQGQAGSSTGKTVAIVLAVLFVLFVVIPIGFILMVKVFGQTVSDKFTPADVETKETVRIVP